MKPNTAIIVFFAIMILSSITVYHFIVNIKLEKQRENFGKLCSIMTEELNKKIDENSSCTSYYCYYLPYAPPPGMENTETLCACDCKLINGSVVTIQILANK